MGLSLPDFVMPTRAVVIMMDDGVCVHKVVGNKVKFIGGAPWRASGFEDLIAEFIRQADAGSVVILNDAVEQHYRKEKVTIPTSFDKANIIKRRLHVAFPSYPMRSAIELKPAASNKKTSDDKGGKGDKAGNLYLFAAAPSSENFTRIIRAVSMTDCTILGYGLLPLEGASIAKALSQKLVKNWGGTTGAAWSIIIGQHRGGGLRQIVVKDNELALTRVTPVDEPKEGLADVWASDVSQELQATLSYLSRFGYVPEDGLNIILLGNKEYATVLDGMISVPCNFEALSPFNAAELLDIKMFNDEGDHYADGLYASWIGKKLSLELPLKSKEISKVSDSRNTAAIFMYILTAVFGGVLYLASDEAVSLYRDSRNLEVAKLQMTEIDELYQQEIKRKEEMGIDINLMNGAIGVSNKVASSQVDFLKLLEEVSKGLSTLRIDGFEYRNEPIAGADGASSLPSGARPFSLKFKFSFPGDINPRDGNTEMDALTARLNGRLKPLGYQAKVSQQLQNLTYTGEVDKEVGVDANKDSIKEKYKAELLIQKVSNDQSSGN
jgi:hypothetical protein